MIGLRSIFNAAVQLKSWSWKDERAFLTFFGSEQHSWFREMATIFPGEECDLQAPPFWIRVFYLSDATETVSLAYRYLRDFIDLVSAHKISNLVEARDILGVSEDALRGLILAMESLLLMARGGYTFRTVEGRLGFAPSRVSPGDTICFIPGGAFTLSVLSQDRREYNTAGVYVEGFMEDDLMNAFSTDESEWEDFHLH